MRDKVPVDENGHADECPKCDSDDLCIDNVEGFECMKCGCWFDNDPEGYIIFARAARPIDLL